MATSRNIQRQTTNWTSGSLSHWDWPLKVTIIDSLDLARQQLSSHQWTRELTVISPAARGTVMNILLISGFPEANYFLNNERKRIKAGIVLLHLPESNIQLTSGAQSAMLARSLQQKTDAAGVFIFKTPVSIGQWFEEWVIQLSHNLGVVDAFNMTPLSASRSYIKSSLNKHTKLSLFTAEIIRQARIFSFRGRAVFEVRLAEGGYRKMTAAQAVQYLHQHRKNLPYDREKGTASTVVNIVKAMAQSGKAVRKIKSPGTRSHDMFGLSGHSPRKKTGRKSIVPARGNRISRGVPKKKAMATKPRKKAAVKPGVTPRYLQAGFRDPANKKPVTSLKPGTGYTFNVLIAAKSPKGFKPLEKPFDDSRLFKKPKVKEVKLDILVKAGSSDLLLQGSITLPLTGKSSTAEFSITTAKKIKPLDLEIAVFYKNRLLQKARYSISVTANPSAKNVRPHFTNEAILTADFSKMEKATAFGASLILPAKAGKKDQPVMAIATEKSWDFRFNSNMQDLIQQIRQDLESLAPTATDKVSLSSKENTTLLRRLANNGSLLYEIYLGSPQFSGPLQLINNSGDYLPIDFTYTLPAPGSKAGLCKNAVQGLKEGRCKNCAKTEEEFGELICPFGFWALSREIERHQYKPGQNSTGSDYRLLTDPGNQRRDLQVMNKVLHGTSARINAVNKNLSSELHKAIKNNCRNLKVAGNWEQWAKEIPSIPDSLLMIVHIEKQKSTGVNALEIGKELLPQTKLDSKYVPAPANGKAPFIVLIGCEANNTDLYLFDTVSTLMNRGAAIVMSNFTKIRGTHAAEILIQLTEILKQYRGKSVRFGEIMLRLRQQLLADGRMMGLTLLSHGGIDWKITA